MGRPAKPMLPAPTATDVCAEGTLSIDGAAAFCSVCKSVIEKALASGELESLYYGRKPLIPRRLLVAWLAAKLERTRGERATNAGR